MTTTQTLTLSISRIVRILGLIIGFLLFASIVTCWLNHLGVRPNAKSLFYVDEEANFPTYFSTVQLFVAAALLSLIARIECREGKPFARHWTFLAVGFLLMSIDELSSIHEKLIIPIRTFLGAKQLGLFYFAWVIPAIVVVAGLGVFFIGFLRHLPKTTRREFMMAATLYLGGAVGMEMLGGKLFELHGRNYLGFYIETHIEEGMEMVGVLVFVRALLRHISDNYAALIMNFRNHAPPENDSIQEPG